ncbi:MAG: ABC transporter permease [Flavobacteriaceae bacterium]|jgi:putative ABC transport system permease protein|nr:ABC transporter permease [Flavobacteriaceae bacterium]MBT4112435.1 ABC transporter permease [Flavobacteriaceae bacterium]MBT4614289.1 ABC transporter permease [Flavobacteriaceae bacterium]MBT5246742.1 ABC transporter permease [Flavobacteriaceae bacterium]MBT5649927.1 ABC transporter permease [Flavobacteriaceae bacterium]
MRLITLIKIGWRNIWRNKKRSLVVILSIILGLYGGLIISSLMITLNSQRMNTAINTYLADIQIHNKEFSKEYSLSDTISNIHYLEEKLKNDNRVKSYSKRTVINGMLSNSTGSYGVNVLGIDPEFEIKVTNVYTKIVEGDYFESKRENTMIVGKKLADKLNLRLRSKVVITFQDVNGDITSLLFRIEGVFKSGNSMFDDYNVFVKNNSIFSNLPDLNGYHEIPILTINDDITESLKLDLQKINNTLDVKFWGDIAVELAYANKMMSSFLYIFMLIVLSGLSFGIINTMLMAILERKKEIGMLMSIGMSKIYIFLMICLETVFLSLVAIPFSVLITYITIDYFSVSGIDLSIVGSGLENFGVGTILYLKLPYEYYFNLSLLVILISFISSMFPAIRALKINPAEATKSI